MSEWLHIETAPKDGRSVLLVGDSNNAMVARAGFWWSCSPWEGWFLDDGENCVIMREGLPIQIYNPTHWAPMLAPPKED